MILRRRGFLFTRWNDTIMCLLLFLITLISPALTDHMTCHAADHPFPDADDQYPAHVQDTAASPSPALFDRETTLDQLTAYALQRNPSVRISREQWRQIEAQYPIAVSLPDPQFMATYFPEPIETRLGPQKWNATLSQMIPFPGKKATSGELVKIDAAMAKLKTDAMARQVAASVAASFHELFYIREAMKITRKNADILTRFRTLAETDHADPKSRTAFMDVIKTQSKLGQIRYDLILLEELERTETTKLNGLLNRPPEAKIGPLYEPTLPLPETLLPLESLYQMAEKSQETIAISRLGIEKAKTQVDLAHYSRKPDFKVGLFYAAIGSPDVTNPPADAGNDAFGIQAGLTLPIWSSRNRSKITQAEAQVLQNRATVEKTVNTVRTDIHNLYFKITNAGRLITLYSQDLLPQALKSMHLASTWFQEGEGAFSDFVEVQASVYNFQLSLARAKADYGKSIALMEPLVGQPVAREDYQKTLQPSSETAQPPSAIAMPSASSAAAGKAMMSKSFLSPFLTIAPKLEREVSGISGNSREALQRTARLLKNEPTLALLEAIVLKRNPDILASEKKVEAEKKTITQADNLDQILIRYTAFTESLMNGVGPMKGREPIQSIFPFPGVTALKGEAATQSVKIALTDLAISQRDAVTAIRKACRKEIYLERAAAITHETLTLFKKLHLVADSLYRSGKTSFQDVIKISIKMNLLEERLVSLRENRTTVQTEMLALMDLPPDTPIGRLSLPTLLEQSPRLARLYADARENRQELIKTQMMIGKAERMLEMAETMILPEMDAGFSKFEDHAVNQVGSSAMQPGFATSVSSSVGAGTPPKPWLGPNLAWLDETRQQILSLRHTLENRKAQTRKMVRQAWDDLDRAIRTARIYEEKIINLSSNALAVSNREYEAGQLSFADVTASYTDWLETNLAHAAALRDTGVATAELEQIIGKSF